MKFLNYAFITLTLVVMIVPFAYHGSTAVGAAGRRPIEWPKELEGRPLRMIDLSGAEKGFLSGFPGAVGRFTDGSREIIIRIIDRETRMLHPAADCLKGAGYNVKPMPLFVDALGRNWGRVEARRSGTVLEVREIILDSRGNSWHDVSSWFWAGVLKRTKGPYTSFVVSTNVSAER